MNQAAKGNNQAFGQLAQQLSGYLYNVCYKFLGSEAQAEDAMQEVLIKLWKAAPNWEAKAQVRTFVYRIAYNHCLDVLRSQKTVIELVDDQSVEPTQVETLYAQEREDYLKKQLETLPENQKMAVTLFYYEEMKQTQIAEIMQMSVKGVESLLSRAKKKLQQQVNPIYKEA